MKVLIVTPDYPNDHGVSYQFVHDRVKQYSKEIDVEVFCYNKKFINDYIYEGIKVSGGNKKQLKQKIKKHNYTTFAFHFMNLRNLCFILKNLRIKRVIVWFHGSDCISWKRRLPAINYKIKKLINPFFILKLIAFITFNKFRLFGINLLNRLCDDITFVFVSKWNKKMSEQDLKIRFRKYAIIPNYIKIDEFKYNEKDENNRLKVLSINNYANDIYAGDIIRDIILNFSTKKEFASFSFYIYGQGKFFAKYINPLKKFKNVHIYEGILKEKEIVKLHDKCGIFLYPKRGDSQGVLRCEAMASGLVPVASNVEAVSEFTPAKTSYLVNDIDDFVNALIDVYYNPRQYLNKSKNAAQFIRKKCSFEKTIRKEIALFEKS